VFDWSCLVFERFCWSILRSFIRLGLIMFDYLIGCYMILRITDMMDVDWLQRSPFIRLSTTSANCFDLQVDDLVAKRQRGISSVEDWCEIVWAGLLYIGQWMSMVSWAVKASCRCDLLWIWNSIGPGLRSGPGMRGFRKIEARENTSECKATLQGFRHFEIWNLLKYLSCKWAGQVNSWHIF
jgi:hypothetical protein